MSGYEAGCGRVTNGIDGWPSSTATDAHLVQTGTSCPPPERWTPPHPVWLVASRLFLPPGRVCRPITPPHPHDRGIG